MTTQNNKHSKGVRHKHNWQFVKEFEGKITKQHLTYTGLVVKFVCDCGKVKCVPESNL